MRACPQERSASRGAVRPADAGVAEPSKPTGVPAASRPGLGRQPGSVPGPHLVGKLPRHWARRLHARAPALLLGLGVLGLGVLGLGACQSPAPADRHDEHAEEQERHGGPEQQTVTLSPIAVRRSGVELGPVRAGRLAASIEVTAEVQLHPDRVAHVEPLVPGQLREVRAALGDHVDAGQVLAVLSSVELGRARADDRRASALVAVAEADLARQERLRSEGITSERSRLEAQLRVSQATAERDAARSRLRVLGSNGGSGADQDLGAPIAGTVIARHATRGENVGQADELFVIADLSTVWVIGRVHEQHVAAVREGALAVLTLRAFPGRTWSGRIAWVASSLDEESRTLAVRVELDNPDGALRPGLFGTLRLDDSGGDPTPIVPQSAVQEIHGRSVVFVPGEDPHTFRSVPVLIGAASSGQVEVLDGLVAGDRVVVQGAFVLKSQLLRGELGEGHGH